jgi:sugar lactone lactonase YvrE
MSKPQVLLDCVAFGESPRWHGGRLWFADWGAQEVVAVDLDGHRETPVRVDFPSFPMCIDFLPDGRLLIVAAREGRLLRVERDGSLVTHADLSGLSEKPWNDIVVDGRGNASVNNVGFDFPGGEFAPGILALVTPDGSVRQVAEAVAFPNGIAVTPDNQTFILAESYAESLTAFDIADDGGLTRQRVWARVHGDHPDGICIDTEGAVWYADVGNKHCVRVREDGEVLQTVEFELGCFACMLGGNDGATLFVVAGPWPADPSARSGRVLTVRAPAPRAGWP